MRKRLYILFYPLLILLSCKVAYRPVYDVNSFKNGEWYIFKDFKYKGKLSNGLPEGNGEVIYSNGLKVVGNFTAGVLNDSHAKITIPNFGTVVGKYVDGVPINGEITYANGDYYKGDLDKKYTRSGKGVLTTKAGDVYFGEFLNNNQEGQGGISSVNSNKVQLGNFSKGKLDGEVITFNNNGTLSLDYFKNGLNNTENFLRDQLEIKRQNQLKSRENLIQKKTLEATAELQEERRKLKEKKEGLMVNPQEMDKLLSLRVQRAGGSFGGYIKNYEEYTGYLKISGREAYNDSEKYQEYRYHKFVWNSEREYKDLKWPINKFGYEEYKVVEKFKDGSFQVYDDANDITYKNYEWIHEMTVSSKLNDNDVIELAKRIKQLEPKIKSYMNYLINGKEGVDQKLIDQEVVIDKAIIEKEAEIRKKIETSNALKSEAELKRAVAKEFDLKKEKLKLEREKFCENAKSCLCGCMPKGCFTCEL